MLGLCLVAISRPCGFGMDLSLGPCFGRLLGHLSSPSLPPSSAHSESESSLGPRASNLISYAVRIVLSNLPRKLPYLVTM